MKSVILALVASVLCTGAHAQPVAKALVVLSSRFVQFANGPEKAQQLVQRELGIANDSFVRQKIDLRFHVAGFEVLDLQNEFDPSELCVEFEASVQDPSLKSSRFNKIFGLRRSYKADLVIFMVNSVSGLIAQSENFGLTCRGNPAAAEYAQLDNSFVIVDRLGLEKLTLAHELGHFLGIKDHGFSNPQAKAATLMVANGRGFQRIPYWSDREYQFNGKSLMPKQGEPDVDVIRRNISLATNRCEAWLNKEQ